MKFQQFTAFNLAVSFLLTVGGAVAQDTRAGAILDAMSSKYKTIPSFSASFTYNTEGAASDSYKGSVTTKGTKFRLKLAGQEVFNDGKQVATFVKETNEVNISDYEAGDNDLNPANVYSIYKKGYKYRFIEETKEGGQTYEVVELTPDKKDTQVTKVRITVNKKDKSVKTWKVTNKNGQTQTFRIDKFTPNPGVADSFFVFDKSKYPGVEVVDLR
ncbi:MAG: outer membrane lipoprotein carrier protein LolA [Cytophagaceae bacterium]|nr:outer membrane lipoprotein carrier protein LolA [Cytophagaceae bacterium]